MLVLYFRNRYNNWKVYWIWVQSNLSSTEIENLLLVPPQLCWNVFAFFMLSFSNIVKITNFMDPNPKLGLWVEDKMGTQKDNYTN